MQLFFWCTLYLKQGVTGPPLDQLLKLIGGMVSGLLHPFSEIPQVNGGEKVRIYRIVTRMTGAVAGLVHPSLRQFSEGIP